MRDSWKKIQAANVSQRVMTKTHFFRNKNYERMAPMHWTEIMMDYDYNNG